MTFAGEGVSEIMGNICKNYPFTSAIAVGILSIICYYYYTVTKTSNQNSEKMTTALSNPDYKTASTIYEFTVRDIKGNEIKLDKYKGHVCLIVNVASKCGLTATNYKELNELYEEYGESKGLKILAFPCNQFNGQEPGGPDDICQFAKDRNVQFDLFDKVDVNGDKADPLWKFLKYKQPGTLGKFIKWNFAKFIVDKNGVPVERHGPNTDPKSLVKYLEKYW